MSGPRGVGSPYYHLSGVALGDQPCQGTACFVARHLDPRRWEAARDATPRVHCLGKCYAAPATAADHGRPTVAVATATSVVLERIARGDAPALTTYTGRGGYESLDRALAMDPGSIVAEIEESGLRGRGGAASRPGAKLRTVRAAVGRPKFVVCNADEGDPGAYIDRFLLEDDPTPCSRGWPIAGRCGRCRRRGYVYVRKEYPARLPRCSARSPRRGRRACSAPACSGAAPLFDVDVVDGEGSYVCGEETALLNAIEGRRPEVRARPPYPAEHGTVRSSDAGRQRRDARQLPVDPPARRRRVCGAGHGRRAAGTKVVSLNSLFAPPGSLRGRVRASPCRRSSTVSAAASDRRARRACSSADRWPGSLPPHLLDTPLAFEELRRSVPTSATAASSPSTSTPRSPSSCTTCSASARTSRAASARPAGSAAPSAEDLFAAVLEGARHDGGSAVSGDDVVAALAATSLCGHGTGLAAFAQRADRTSARSSTRCLG